MTSSPPVSLLVPTHNSATTVADALQSCVSQTFNDLEILVYDEASKDNTREIIAGFAARDARIRVMTSDTNSGPLRAWRKLLHEARGRWTTFVWADDIILPRYVERLAGALQENPADLMAGCNAYCYRMTEDSPQPATPIKWDQPGSDWKLLNEFATARVKGDEYALGIFAKIYPVTQMCNLFDTATAREVFDHYIEIENPYGFDFSRHAYGNDVAFLSEMGLRSKKLMQFGEPLVIARATPGSLTERIWHTDRWRYWLQYTWAFRHAWKRCRAFSPRMDALIRMADDRVNFCDTFYSLKKRRWPREGNPFKVLRAIWFIVRHDHHVNRRASAATMKALLDGYGDWSTP